MSKDHSVFKENIISLFSFNQHFGLILIGTGSQVSDVAHGPLVLIVTLTGKRLSVHHSEPRHLYGVVWNKLDNHSGPRGGDGARNSPSTVFSYFWCIRIIPIQYTYIVFSTVRIFLNIHVCKRNGNAVIWNVGNFFYHNELGDWKWEKVCVA